MQPAGQLELVCHLVVVVLIAFILRYELVIMQPSKDGLIHKRHLLHQLQYLIVSPWMAQDIWCGIWLYADPRHESLIVQILQSLDPVLIGSGIRFPLLSKLFIKRHQRDSILIPPTAKLQHPWIYALGKEGDRYPVAFQYPEQIPGHVCYFRIPSHEGISCKAHMHLLNLPPQLDLQFLLEQLCSVLYKSRLAPVLIVLDLAKSPGLPKSITRVFTPMRTAQDVVYGIIAIFHTGFIEKRLSSDCLHHTTPLKFFSHRST